MNYNFFTITSGVFGTDANDDFSYNNGQIGLIVTNDEGANSYPYDSDNYNVIDGSMATEIVVTFFTNLEYVYGTATCKYMTTDNKFHTVDMEEYTLTELDELYYDYCSGLGVYDNIKEVGEAVKSYKISLPLLSGAVSSSITMEFEITHPSVSEKTVTYTLLDNCHYTLAPLSPITMESGDSITFVATADKGWKFAEYYDSFWNQYEIYAFITAGSNLLGGVFSDDLKTITFSPLNFDELTTPTTELEISIAIVEDPDDPDVPEPPEPTGTRKDFVTVYSPTDENMQTINDAIFLAGSDTLSMSQYFMSYRQFFVEIPNAGICTLKAGKYSFGTTAPFVSRLTQVASCGTQFIEEIYHNFSDYSPYAECKLYLPFVGFTDISDDDVINKYVTINYTIDILTGKALCEVFTASDEEQSDVHCVMQFSCPVAKDLLFGLDGGYEFTNTNQLLSTFILGDLEPYFIIKYKRPLDTSSLNYDGRPADEVKKVGDCIGYAKFKTIFANGMIATEAEKREIESLLMSGVLVD